MNNERDVIINIKLAIKNHYEKLGRLGGYDEADMEELQGDLIAYIEKEVCRIEVKHKEELIKKMDFKESDVYD